MPHAMHAAIAEQAYYLWLKDGMTDGRAEAHWVAAERLLAKATIAAAAPAAKPVKAKAAKNTKSVAAPRAARIRATEARLHS